MCLKIGLSLFLKGSQILFGCQVCFATSGDGSFHIVLRNSKSRCSNFVITKGVFARFSIHLHVRELEVLKGIFTYLKLYNEKEIISQASSNFVTSGQSLVTEPDKKITVGEKSVNLQITKFHDIINIIIPFFNQYPIFGLKSLDFADFKKVCEIIKTKEHLTSPAVFNKILKLKSGMNQHRKW